VVVRVHGGRLRRRRLLGHVAEHASAAPRAPRRRRGRGRVVELQLLLSVEIGRVGLGLWLDAGLRLATVQRRLSWLPAQEGRKKKGELMAY
jgi:hypothetical protein